MKTILTSILESLSRKTSTTSRPASRQVRPSMESLEKRELLAGNIFLNSTGLLTIDGTMLADKVDVQIVNNMVKVTMSQPGQNLPVTTASFAMSKVTHIVFHGFDGDDVFTNWTKIDSDAFGGKGNDVLRGGSGRDRLFGEDGADKLYGGAGDDYLNGGTGRDYLYGQDGDDILNGGGSDGALDYLYGGLGKDKFKVNPIDQCPDFNMAQGDVFI
jgi:Ca2+-binding RTX toxin-like protein